MQTIFYETSSFIRHEGNVVDLAAYQQGLAAVSGGDGWTATPTGEEGSSSSPQAHLRLLEPKTVSSAPRPRTRRKRRISRLALALDLCASLAVVALTITAIIQFLRLI